MSRAARLFGVVALASALGCSTSTFENSAGVDAGTRIGVFSYGTVTYSGALTGTHTAVAFATYDNFVGPFHTDGGDFLYFSVSSPVGVDFKDLYPPVFGCAFLLPGTSLQPGRYSPNEVIDFNCGVSFQTDAGVYEMWTQSTFELNITATGPVLSFDGTPNWDVPTVLLTAVLLPFQTNPTDAGVGFNASVAPPDCSNPAYSCRTY
jgi:hypothetical protein